MGRITTKSDIVFNFFKSRIANGDLEEGSLLLSIRQAAASFGFSTNTIVDAYDKLVAEGFISSHPGAGFHVEKKRVVPANSNVGLVEAEDNVTLLKAMLDKTLRIRAGDGRAPSSWTSDIMSELKTNALPKEKFDEIADLGSAMGYEYLREFISIRHQAKGMSLEPSQILTTFGANNALDLIIRRFLVPGDTVFVDEPGYYPLFEKLKLAKVRAIGIPRIGSGPNVEVLKDYLKYEKPVLFFTQSLAQNPTGTSFDLTTANAVLGFAEKYEFLIVDDDPFIDIPGIKGVRLANLDNFNRVIYVGSVSKTLPAAFRFGYIACAKVFISALTDLKMITAVNTSLITEMIIAKIYANNRYQKHLKRMSNRLIDGNKYVLNELSSLGLKPEFDPVNGFYFFVKLSDSTNDIELARKAIKNDIFLAPGSLFYPDPTKAVSSLRINITRSTDGRLYRFLKSNL